MDRNLFAGFSAIPPLAAAAKLLAPCKICGAAAPSFDIVDFDKFCSEIDPRQPAR